MAAGYASGRVSMGKRGPAPKPTNLRLLHGDKEARINRAEPKPRDLPPGRPAWLSPLAAEEWDRVAPDLARMGTAKAIDATGLAAYCEAVARFRAASDLEAHRQPIIIDRDGRPRMNPAVRVARDASYEMRVWAREFGLTPSARSPLRIEHSGSLGALPAERLLT
jgi:P27 family predicted phage terminase small subunit